MFIVFLMIEQVKQRINIFLYNFVDDSSLLGKMDKMPLVSAWYHTRCSQKEERRLKKKIYFVFISTR